MKTNKALLLLGCLAIAGCASPEATRTRGSTQGGDPGNRPPEVKMHEGSDPYWKTRVVIPGEPPSVEPARQARKLSTR